MLTIGAKHTQLIEVSSLARKGFKEGNRTYLSVFSRSLETGGWWSASLCSWLVAVVPSVLSRKAKLAGRTICSTVAQMALGLKLKIAVLSVGGRRSMYATSVSDEANVELFCVPQGPRRKIRSGS